MKKTLRKMIALFCAIAMMFTCVACGSGNSVNTGKEGKTATATPTKAESTPTETPATPTETPATPTPTEKQATPTPEQGKNPSGSRELTAGSSGQPAETKVMDEVMRKAYETFAYQMFRTTTSGETRMISPFSIYTALAMLANGADGNTLAQIDKLLGLTDTERNAYLAAWIAALTSKQTEAVKFTNADSLWIRKDREQYVPTTFLNTCAQYYKAAVFSALMNDETVQDVNNWVDQNTMGMIKELVKELSPDNVMILLNAIALDAKWASPFAEARIVEDYDFTKADGTKQKVEMMFDDMTYGYLENESATGFIKSYEGGAFSYVALLPKEGVSIEALIDSLQPGVLRNLCLNAESGDITIGLPKYKTEYEVILTDALMSLGMTDAFDDDLADLSRLFEGIHTNVSKVVHKTFISVDDKGTKAAAVTGIFVDEATCVMPGTPYRVILDRPFVYVIVDSEGLPIFMGTYEG